MGTPPPRRNRPSRKESTPGTTRFQRFRGIFRSGDRREDVRLGKLLIQQGILDPGQVECALKVQRDKLEEGRPFHLGMIIVDLGYASEEEVLQAVNDHYGLSAASLNENIAEMIRLRQSPFSEIVSSPRIPIWLQLSVMTTFIIILAIFSLSYVTLGQQREQLYQQTLEIGIVSLNYFSNNARIPLLDNNVLGLNSLIREATDVEGIRYAIITDNKGRIKAHTDHNRLGDQFERFPSAGDLQHRGDVTYYNYVDRAGEKMLNLTRKITFQNRELGEVHVGVSLDFIQELVRKKAVSILVVTFAIIFFGVMIAILLGIRFSKPVSVLALATEEISKGNYQHKVDLVRNDELGNLAAAFNRMSRELWKKSLMEKSFGKYVGSEVLEMIMAKPESLWLKGHRQEATILFTDIRGFTSYSEVKEPEDVVEKLNEYLDITTNVILSYGGYVDKFIGDAVLGIFGIPVRQRNHVVSALKAAVEIQRRLNRAAKWGNPLLSVVGIGINTGVVVSGNIGCQVKMEYTVIGDTVNVASRINGLAGPGEIIISKSIFESQSRRIKAVPLPPHTIKGKTEPVEVYKLIDTLYDD